jgi:hypothetical protein
MISLDEACKVLNQGFRINDWAVMQNEIGQIGGEILKLCKEKGITFYATILSLYLKINNSYLLMFY